MSIYQRPDEKVFAQNALPGELQEFPDILRGWGITFEQTDGFPPMEWFNALAKRQDEAIRYMIQQGIPEWSASEQYPTGAYVKHGARTWRSKTANTNKQPDTNPEDWVEWGFDRTALDGKLGKTETAADSAKLGGQLPEHYAKASDLAKAAGIPLLFTLWCPNRAAIPAGYAPADGQTLSRSLYPDAWSGIAAGSVPTVADVTWLSTPTERGKFTAGDGSTTFRLPDYNGKAAGSLGAVLQRGDGALSAGVDGVIQPDAMQGHRHMMHQITGNSANTGVPRTEYNGDSNNTGALVNNDIAIGPTISDGTNGTPRTAAETRPINVTGCWVIRLFGSVTNPGAADASQLATEVARLWAQKLELSAFSGSNQLLADTGYQRLPGGLIVQWGSVPASATSIVFPVVFPGAALKVILQADIGSTGAIAGTDVKVATKTVTGFTRPAGVIAAGIYFAIGY
ncbi:phage tail protein [Laribacter hongkongensis]|uniref:phage tail protein n=1 Tax=Laribacter hongkongensis TaxID=168471 RepID=UPI001EFE3604|nr:phage tail protein [Laribacter hongkongensis]MCG9064730.1 phage tail protein [Laribacter hongkongensis]